MERIQLTGKLTRGRTRKPASRDWLKDLGALIAEDAGLRKPRLYPETIYLNETGRLTPKGNREQVFNWSRSPKALAEVPNGARVTITAQVEWWHNGLGGTLRRTKLVEVVPC